MHRPSDVGGVVLDLLCRFADGGLLVRQFRRLTAKLIELTCDEGRLIDGSAQIRMGPLQLVVRVSHDLALRPQRFDRCPGLPIFDGELLHRLAVLLELSSRIGHERGGLLGLPHDVRNLLYLRTNRFEACNPLVEISDARDDRRELLGRINRLVPDVLDRGRHFGEPAAAPVELLKQGVERITLVPGGGHNRVQFVRALLRFGAEGQLFEHVRLQSAVVRRHAFETE